MIAVLRVPSSADKSHWTDARVRHRGKSLIKMQNRIFMIIINSSNGASLAGSSERFEFAINTMRGERGRGGDNNRNLGKNANSLLNL